jgi:hypothetical protein
MTRGLAYWILMIIWLVIGVVMHFGLIGSYGIIGFAAIPFLLFGLVGWQVFGPPVR